MRVAFTSQLIKHAKEDERIFVLTGDLGYCVLEEFKSLFPGRFLNVGVAEANMAGMAAGLAHSGKIPFIYSIGTFATARCFEQIRNDICYQNLNVKIVGIGSGYSYSLYGATHLPVDDIAIMRILPNIVIACPGDPVEIKLAVTAALQHIGPFYLRIAAKGEPIIHQQVPKFKIGKGIVIEEGDEVTIIATGNALENAKAAADQLKKQGISTGLVSMPFIKPFDKELILNLAKKTKAIFSVEEHSLIGGLGSAIAEILAEEKINIVFKRIAMPDEYPPMIGCRHYMRNAYGLTAEKIVEKILSVYKK